MPWRSVTSVTVAKDLIGSAICLLSLIGYYAAVNAWDCSVSYLLFRAHCGRDEPGITLFLTPFLPVALISTLTLIVCALLLTLIPILNLTCTLTSSA